MSEAADETKVEGVNTGGDMSTSYGRGNENRSFQEELKAIILEQKDLLTEYKETQGSRMFSYSLSTVRTASRYTKINVNNCY